MTHDARAVIALAIILGFHSLVVYCMGWIRGRNAERDHQEATRFAIHLNQIRGGHS